MEYSGFMPSNRKTSNRGKKTINEYPDEKHSETIKDYSQTKEIVKVLSTEIGNVVDQLLGVIYNVETADRFADSIITIYNRLVGEGITQTTAEKILCEYSANIDKFASMLKKKEK